MEFPPLIFQSVAVEKVWGGSLLADLRLCSTASQNVGEAWEISDYPGRRTAVVGGTLHGATLDALLRDYKGDLLGDAAAGFDGRFPLLLKLVHARERLSLQVHPSCEQAELLGTTDGGKEEAWLVLEAEKNSRIALGLKEGTSGQDFASALSGDSAEEVVNWISVEPGDFIPIPPGTIHAIDGGLLLMEIQQTSDATYRIHDWGRIGRELHRELALRIVNLGFVPSVQPCPKSEKEGPLLYRGNRIEVRAERVHGLREVKLSRFMAMFCADGEFEISNAVGEVKLVKYSSALIAANPPSVRIKGEGLLLFMQSR